MAITYTATGTAATTGGGSTLSPGLPSGWAADDIHLMIVCNQNGETASASGWTQVLTANNNAASQNTQVTLLYRRAVGGDGAPTTNSFSVGTIARIVGFRGCTTSGAPYSATSSRATDVNTATVTVDTITPSASTDMIVIVGGTESEFSPVTFSGYSGTDPTFTEAADSSNSAGANWTQVWAAYGTTSGAAMGSRTVTCSSGAGVIHVAFALSLTAQGAAASSPPDRRRRTAGRQAVNRASTY